MKTKWFIGLTISILITITLVTIFFFISNFYDQGISKNITQWGEFGSFLWGFLSVIISIANLVFFILLTLKVSKIQEDWNNFNIMFERKKILTEYRHRAIEEFSRMTNDYLLAVATVKVSSDYGRHYEEDYFESVKINDQIRSYIPIYGYFFMEGHLEERFGEILKIVAEIQNTLKKEVVNHKEYILLLSSFRSSANKTVSDLQQFNMTVFSEERVVN